MRCQRLVFAFLVVLMTGTLCSCAGESTLSGENAAAEGVVAVWDGGEIAADELERTAEAKLLEARQRLYETQVKALRELAVERLIRDRAEAADKDEDTYWDEQVAAVIELPSEEEIAQVVEQYRDRLPEDDEQARARVRQALESRARQEAERSVEAKLLRDAGFRVRIEPPRVDVPVSENDMSRGPEDAPVRIVEFTDYQCPYCGRAQETLERLRETYGDKLRFVFKDFPLNSHPEARMGAEAARCAGDQGAFWQLHDWMFEHPGELSRETVLGVAAEMELDPEALAACLDEKRHAAAVDASIEQARQLGVSSTPTFFINGRPVRGAQPYEVFAAIIDDELARTGSAE